MQYWLMKTEPGAYSIDDLKRDKVTPWDGIRNYQARNIMRDDMKVGDRVIVYHSNANPPAAVGIGEVASAPYPDPTQFDSEDSHYDPKSSTENPRWVLVDVAFVEKFARPVTLHELKNDPFFEKMLLVQRGVRLSIQPVRTAEFKKIYTLGVK